MGRSFPFSGYEKNLKAAGEVANKSNNEGGKETRAIDSKSIQTENPQVMEEREGVIDNN